MKRVCLLLFVFLCIGCTSNHEKVTTALRLCTENKEATDRFEKHEPLLIEALPLASKVQKKRILLHLCDIYQQQDKQRIPDAADKGLARCKELQDNYSLSQKERWAVKKIQALLLNRHGQQEQYVPLWFELLKEHRAAGEPSLIIEDLFAIGNHYEQLGDKRESLSIYKEAYEIAKENRLTEFQKNGLIYIINLSFDLGQYKEVLDLCKQIGTDSVRFFAPPLYFLISKSHLHLHRSDSARFYLWKMNRYKKGSGNEIYCRLAETYIAENKEDSARFYLDKAMNLFHERVANYSLPPGTSISFPGYFLPIYTSFGSLLQAKGKLQEAGETFVLMEPLMNQEEQDPSQWAIQIDALTRYSSFCKATRQYEKALDLLERRDSIRHIHQDFQESRNSQNLFNRLQTSDLRHTIERKDELMEERFHFQVITFSLLLLSASFSVITIRNFIKKSKLAKELQNKEQQIKELEAKQHANDNPLFKAFQSLMTSKELFRQPQLKIEEVAKMLSTHRNELSGCINQCSGKSFPQYLTACRMQYFIERFDSMENIETLIREAGFNSPSNFYKLFKEMHGMPPKKYLQQKKRELIIQSSLP